MNLSYLSPLPLYWVYAAVFVAIAWLVTLRATARLKALVRSLALAAALSPAMVAVGGHSAAGSGFVPMLALLLRGFAQPVFLLFAVFNALQVLIIWLALHFLLLSFYRARLREPQRQSRK